MSLVQCCNKREVLGLMLCSDRHTAWKILRDLMKPYEKFTRGSETFSVIRRLFVTQLICEIVTINPYTIVSSYLYLGFTDTFSYELRSRAQK